MLLRWADLIEKHRDELALIETLDCGKPIMDARNVDLPDSIETLRWHAEAPPHKIYDLMSPAPADVVSMITREPMGVRWRGSHSLELPAVRGEAIRN